MFTHDPFQAYQSLYQTLGAFGGGAPYGLPHPGIHPLALALQQQPLNYPGIGGLGHYAQQLQGYPQQLQGYPQQLQGYPQQLQGYPQQQNPWQQLTGWNPLAIGLQYPLQHSIGQPGLQNPLLNPLLGYQTWQQQQTPFGYPLAPQSFLGAGGIGQPYSQINPLAQFAFRQPGMGY